jgi:C1A family cysteine protease
LHPSEVNLRDNRRGIVEPRLPAKDIIPKYGWVNDSPDPRDHPYVPPPGIEQNLPKKVDLRTFFPEVYNQGNLNSCTANAIAAALEFDEIKQGFRAPFVPSRLFIYFNERAMEGKIGSDSGAQIRDGMKSVAKQGVCKEEAWPYLEEKLKTRPTKRCFAEARKFESLEYQKLRRNLVHLKSCLASGFPFVFGIKVYSSFESLLLRKTGHLEMPRKHEKFVGKHAVIAAGYDDGRKWFIVRNSWGRKWGIKGYFTLPYDYILDRNLSADIWTIRRIR